MEAKVLPSKILVSEKKKADKITQAGIILSAAVSSKDPCVTGTVEAFGDNVSAILGSQIATGLTVLFSPHSFQRVRIEETDYMLLDSRDVLAYW
jgi:co-chaperonin GroES (HSP10)